MIIFVDTDLESATHWIPYQDDSLGWYNDVIVGKPYPILYDEKEEK